MKMSMKLPQINKEYNEEINVDFSKLTKGEISEQFKQFSYTSNEYISGDFLKNFNIRFF